MKRFFVYFTVLAMFLFSGAVAGAQTDKPAQPPNYAALKAGAYFPNSGDLSGFDTGFNGEAAFGRYFNQYAAGELGVGYFKTSAAASASGSGFSASAKADVYAIPLTVAVRAILPVDKFEFYGIGGMGAYFCNVKVDVTAASGKSKFSASESSTATSFGGFLGAGANFNIDKYWYLGIEGKYLWTTPSFSASGGNVDVKMDGFVLTADVGIRF